MVLCWKWARDEDHGRVSDHLRAGGRCGGPRRRQLGDRSARYRRVSRRAPRPRGGTSNAARDARMRQLIEDHISLASTRRTVPLIVEAKGQRFADGGWTLYLAAQRLKDDRWRYQSPAGIARFYSDFGWKSTDAKIHLVGGLGSQNFPPAPWADRVSVPF